MKRFIKKPIVIISFLLSVLLVSALQFTPPEIIYKVFIQKADAKNITNLSGYTGKVGKEDINFGTGQDTDTFSVPTYSGSTITLTKVPSLFANAASIIKGKWYVAAMSGDQGNVSLTGSLAWAINVLGTDPATIELPGNQTYSLTTNLAIPETIVLNFQRGAILGGTANISGGGLKHIQAGAWQIFSTSGTITFPDGSDLKSSWFADFETAITKISTAEVSLEVTKADTIANDTTVNANTTLKWAGPGKAQTISATKTLTINGPFEAGFYQVFSGSGTVVFGIGAVEEVYLEYWGNGVGTADSHDSFSAAFNSLPTAGGTIKLLPGVYTMKGFNFHSKDDIHVIGSGPSTTIRPYWDEVLPYNNAAYGNEIFNVQDCSRAEFAHFKVDLRYSDGLTTETFPRFLTTYYTVGSGTDNIWVHDIYGYNGGDVHDRAFASFYKTKNVRFENNTVLDYDCGILIERSESENAIITDNIILGGKSEGISVYHDTASSPNVHDRRVVISNNVVSGKYAAAINVQNVTNSNVIISNNVLGTTTRAATAYGGKGISLDECSDVLISNNTFTGPGQFIYVSNNPLDNISIISNRVKHSLSFFNNASTQTLTNITVQSNVIDGVGSAPAWSATVTYEPGEFVTSGGSYYYCIAETTNNAPPNATYWTAYSPTEVHFKGYFTNLNFSNNVFSDVLCRPFNINSVSQATFIGNRIVNSAKNVYIGTVATVTIDDVRFIGNSIEVTGSGESAFNSISLWLKNSVFADNYFETQGTYGSVSFGNHAVQNTSFINNTLVGAHTDQGYSELYGCLRKFGNVTDKSAWNDKDTPVSGYVNKGEAFYKTDPSAGGTMGSVCTTAGYAYKEAYDSGHSYVTGEHVQGSDSKVYVCILDDPGDASHAPTTGGSWSTYWELADGVGTPLAVMKTFGDITP